MRTRFSLPVLLCVCCAYCQADTVFLKDGTEVEGTVTEDTDVQIVIKLENGSTRTIRRANVETVVKSAKAAARVEQPAPEPVKTPPPAPVPAAPVTAPKAAADPADAERKYSFKFPDDFKVRETGPGETTGTAPDGRTNIILNVRQLNLDTTLDVIVGDTLKVMGNEFTEFKKESDEKLELDGCAARKIVVSSKEHGLTVKVAEYFVISDKRVFVVAGATTGDQFEKYQPVFEKAAKSLNTNVK